MGRLGRDAAVQFRQRLLQRAAAQGDTGSDQGELSRWWAQRLGRSK